MNRRKLVPMARDYGIVDRLQLWGWRMKKRIVGVGLLFVAGALYTGSVLANTIVVNSTADTSSACSLRNAIVNANANGQTYPGCNAGNGADTIVFDPVVFATPQTIVLASTLPDLTDASTTTIDGANMVTISGNNAVRVFWIGDLGSGNGSAIIRNLTISHALGSGYGGGMAMVGTDLELDHVTFDHNATDLGGGGLSSQSGTVVIHDCLFTGNSTASYIGGGYYFQGTAGTVTHIDNTTFTGNSAGSGGGAISTAYGGELFVTNSTFEGNSSSSGHGAAIRNFKVSAVTLDYVTIVNNTATSSNGALDVENDGTISISNSIVAGNAGNDCRDSRYRDGTDRRRRQFLRRHKLQRQRGRQCHAGTIGHDGGSDTHDDATARQPRDRCGRL